MLKIRTLFKVIAAAGTLLLLGVFVWSFFIQSSSTMLLKTRPLAEFEPTFAMAMSEDLLAKEAGVPLLKEIIRSGAKVYLLRKSESLDDDETSRPHAPGISQEEWDQVVTLPIDHESFWIRDYLPLPLLKLFPNLPPIPSFMDFVYRNAASDDDVAIYRFALTIDASIEHLPIVLDGGNFMTDGTTCILSQELNRDSEAPSAPSHPKSSELLAIVREALGCHELLTVPSKPHPHVDMWIKFMGKNQVVVNQIEARTMERAKNLSQQDQTRIEEIQKTLDEVAQNLARSLEVTRLPMPLPSESAFMTYANAIIVNQTIIAPSFSPKMVKLSEHPDADLFDDYQRKAAEVFGQFGLKTVFLSGDQLIREGGSFHCVTYHLNHLELISRKEGPKTPN